MPNRKAAYGAPPEEKEIVVTMDRRVLYAAGLLVLALALVGGIVFARRTAPAPVTSQAPAGGAAPSGALGELPPGPSEAEARQTAEALGLGKNVAIVPGVTRTFVTEVPPAAGTVDPFATVRAASTPAPGAVNPTVAALQTELPGQDIVIPPDFTPVAANWTHDVLASFPDANLADPKLVPERTEKVSGRLPGPRIAVAELNDQYTFDFGVVPLSQPSTHVFTASNVGDKDLVISRVYTGCGCTALSMGDQPINGSGFLEPPMVLKPGESVPFSVQFDPRAEGKTGAQAKFVQIYSNDPTKTLFDPKDPNSAEVRFRFVVEPRGKLGSETGTPAPPVATPKP